MKRCAYTTFAVAGLLVGFLPGLASAQNPTSSAQNPTIGRPSANPLGTPAFSPFLNMGRGGNAALNYYGLVKPQIQSQQQLQLLQQEQQLLEQATLGGGQVGQGGLTGPQTGMPGTMTGLTGQSITGHAARFNSLSHYYPSTAMGVGGRR